MRNFFICLVAAISVTADAHGFLTRRYLTDKYCGEGFGEEYAYANCKDKTVGCSNEKKDFVRPDAATERNDAATYCDWENFDAERRDCGNRGARFFGNLFGTSKEAYDREVSNRIEYYYTCLEDPAKMECESKTESGAIWENGKCKQRTCDECGCFNAYVERGKGNIEYDDKKRYECCKAGKMWQIGANKCVRAPAAPATPTAPAPEPVIPAKAGTVGADKTETQTTGAFDPNSSDTTAETDEEREFVRRIEELTRAFYKKVLELNNQ